MSYDLKSHFTNVPSQEEIYYILDEIYVKSKLPKLCSKLIFKRLLLKLTTENNFIFTSNFYKQTVAQWADPLSVIFSYIYEQNGTSSCQNIQNFTNSPWMILLKAHSQVWDNFWKLEVFLKWRYLRNCLELFVLKIFKILSWLFGHVAKRLDKFYDVTVWLKTIAMHILSTISRSKGNQTMKFGQWMEYKMRNIFHGKIYLKCGAETSPRPFLKN